MSGKIKDLVFDASLIYISLPFVASTTRTTGTWSERTEHGQNKAGDVRDVVGRRHDTLSAERLGHVLAAVDKKLRQIEESTRIMLANSTHHPNANSTRRKSAEGMRRVTLTDLTPAGRNNENLRDEAQIRDLPPRQGIGGRGLPPPGLRQHSLTYYPAVAPNRSRWRLGRG